MRPKTVEQTCPWIKLEEMAPFIPKNPIIVEAGSHNGKDTLKLKKQWPNATIHAFEPVPELYKQLVERTANIPNVFCYQQALSIAVGTATMHVSSGRTDACSSLLTPHPSLTAERPDIRFEKNITVATTTLDSWATEHKIKKIDFLWLDLQGAELEALQGAEQLLKEALAIHTEINEVERYIGCVRYPELEQFLKKHNFYPRIKALNSYGWGNAFFVPISHNEIF